MRLAEIHIDGQEPLLITMLSKLLAKGHRVWIKGAFAMLQVRGIGFMIVDRPRTFGREEYHGKAYDIKVHNGIGIAMTPDEAETDWELIHDKEMDAPNEQHWTLKRVKT